MRFTFHSKEYPGAPDLTARSEKIGLYASTLMSFIYAAVIAVVLYFITGSLEVIVLSAILILVMPIVMSIVRKSLFKKLDEEYARRMQNQ